MRKIIKFLRNNKTQTRNHTLKVSNCAKIIAHSLELILWIVPESVVIHCRRVLLKKGNEGNLFVGF